MYSSSHRVLLLKELMMMQPACFFKVRVMMVEPTVFGVEVSRGDQRKGLGRV